MKEIKRINVLSLAKIYGLSMAIVGFIFGIIVGFIMFFIGSFYGTDSNLSSFAGASLGIAGFLFMPLAFGLIGFIFSAIAALIYNMLASWVGGICIEVIEKEEE